jgi:hypothetical protein
MSWVEAPVDMFTHNAGEMKQSSCQLEITISYVYNYRLKLLTNCFSLQT